MRSHLRNLALSLCATFIASSWATLVAPNALNLKLTTNITHEIPSTLYGWMWEDLNHSGDGGLYAELIQNRAFQGTIPGTQNASVFFIRHEIPRSLKSAFNVSLNAWRPFSGARLSVTAGTPGVSAALPNSLEVQVPSAVTGPVGFENTGFWGMVILRGSSCVPGFTVCAGIKVQEGWTYTGSFYAKSDTFNGGITVSLKSNRGTTFASKTVTGVSKNWKKFTFTFQPTVSAPTDENVFNVVVDGKSAAGKTIHFGFFSLFPPTFMGRENGMRIDLAEALAATRPSIWRFPGGNNIEGMSFDNRWKWNETIGPLENRPGRPGDWGYANTDGLGLLEYLNWAEDIGAVRADFRCMVWYCSRKLLRSLHVARGSQADLQPYIDDVLDEIEFIVGDSKTTKGGKLRASLGRTEPYALRFIEIGNEDQFQPESYAAYRWKAFVTAIEAKFPQMEILATTLPSTALTPAYKKIDFHMYSTPVAFEAGAFMFDEYPRNGTQFFIGEYAVTSTNTSNVLGDLPSGRLAFPTLQGAAAEAAFMTGLERNSDVVFAASYAPTFQNIRGYQWTPDILTFDASRMVRSTSYYVQERQSWNPCLATSPTSAPDTAPLFWVASFNNETNVVFLKVSNTGTADLVAYITLDFPTTRLLNTVSIGAPTLNPLSGQFNVSNTLEDPELIIPVANAYAMPQADRFNYTFPATSVTVISLHIAGSHL
ncbi:glycoside hydrolase superfamily [Infundibulicybe gibba]|nr:glycoside hydrolase superfamily [Infundibulicybe gibba]